MSEEIHDTTDAFDFSTLALTKPTPLSGGNFFTRILCGENHLYIQSPKCVTKQGVLKSGKKFYTDLVFTNENEVFIRWMENLENFCQKKLFENRAQWFEGSVEMNDIESYFTSPVKIFKSGKYYSVRANINTVLDGTPAIKIYDEYENDANIESIDDKTSVMSILEITGIKCSPRSFQIEIEIKQLMVMKPSKLFEKRLLSKGAASEPIGRSGTKNEEAAAEPIGRSGTKNEEAAAEPREPVDPPPSENIVFSIESNTSEAPPEPDPVETPLEKKECPEESVFQKTTEPANSLETIQDPDPLKLDGNILEEFKIPLEEIKETDVIHIRKRNEVYYKMYKEAKRKAKIARDLALSSYLEAKQIKNTYSLEDSDSDNDSETENTE